MQQTAQLNRKALDNDDVNNFIIQAMNKGLFIPRNGTDCDRVSKPMSSRLSSDSASSAAAHFITPSFYKTSVPQTTTNQTNQQKYERGSIAEGLNDYLQSKRNANYTRNRQDLDNIMSKIDRTIFSTPIVCISEPVKVQNHIRHENKQTCNPKPKKGLMDLIIENVDEVSLKSSSVVPAAQKVEYIDDLDSRLDFAISENGDNSTRATTSRRPSSTAARLDKFNHALFKTRNEVPSTARKEKKVPALKFTISARSSPRTQRYKRTRQVCQETQTESLSSPEIRCVYSTANRQQEYSEDQSEKSIETLTNSPTPGRLAVSAVFDHSPQPTFEDWSKQTSEFLEFFSSGSTSQLKMGKKRSSQTLRVPRTKRHNSAQPVSKLRKRKSSKQADRI